MCFSLCFRVGFSRSFFASSFVFVVTLNHVREGCSFDCGCWLILIGDLGLSMLVWFLCGHVVIGYAISLTLDRGVIVGDSVWSFWIGLIGSQGIGCDLWSRWVGDLLIGWVPFRCCCMVIMWLYCYELVDRGSWTGVEWLGWFVFNWFTVWLNLNDELHVMELVGVLRFHLISLIMFLFLEIGWTICQLS